MKLKTTEIKKRPIKWFSFNCLNKFNHCCLQKSKLTHTIVITIVTLDAAMIIFMPLNLFQSTLFIIKSNRNYNAIKV